MIEPKNITVIEDEERVWVKFALPGYMESCQIYRKMGRYTDVKVHCLHPDSEDVTVYSAHNLLLSSASTYFSFVLVQAFTQLTELRTNNLKKVLHIVENDQTFVDKSISAEENIVKFKVPFYSNDHVCCSQKHDPVAVTDTVDNSGINSDCYKTQAVEKETFSVILKSFNSANNIIMVVKGIDPVYFSYVLKCIYSESFYIEKKHIQIFLSFIVHIKLTNFALLSTLLEPFIVTRPPQKEEASAPVASSYDNSHKNLNSKSAFRSFENSEDYLVLNSSYDVHQWKDTNEFHPTLLTPTPLDLSCKNLASLNNNSNHNNNNSKDIEMSPYSEQLPDGMHCSMRNLDALKNHSFGNVKHNSIYKYLNPHQWYFNYEEAYPMVNYSGFSAADSYNSRPDGYCQKINVIDSFWQSCSNFNLQNNSQNYVPYINSLVSTNLDPFRNLSTAKTESNLSSSNEFKNHNLDNQVGGSNNGHNNNSHCGRESPQILQKLEKNSSIEIKRLDIPADFESGVKSKQRYKRKFLTDKKSNLIGIKKRVKFGSEDHFTRSCVSSDNSNANNSTNFELPSKMEKSELTDNRNVVKPKKAENLLNSNDGKLVYNINTLSTEKDNFNCFLCEYSSKSISEVIFHMRSIHFNKNSRISKCVDSNCPVQLLFTSKEWETHIQHHFIKYFYQCSNCTYSTKTKKGILRHEMTHKSSYKRMPKVDREKNYIKKKNIQRKSKISRSCVIKTAKKAHLEQISGGNTSSSEVQSCHIFCTPTFKKFQKGLKKRRKDSAILHRIHLQMAKVTKGKCSLKVKKYRTKTGKLFASVTESNEENGSVEGTLNVDKEKDDDNVTKSEEKMTVENTTIEHSSGENANKGHSSGENTNTDIAKPTPTSSVGIPKIKTKTVRFLNKKKFKVLPCSLCNVFLSSEDDLILHYYNSHNMIFPSKCPYRDCDVYLDDTSRLYSHINIHVGEDLMKSQIDTLSSSNETNQNGMTSASASDSDK
ncbi:UNVERIFIED_CONTAM: hypothetical protein RMT77_001716 [Armadillidium vulgare]